MRKEKIIIGGMPIEIIRKNNLKNLYIRVVPPDGNVTVSSPIELKEEDIKLFVLKKLPGLCHEIITTLIKTFDIGDIHFWMIHV